MGRGSPLGAVARCDAASQASILHGLGLGLGSGLGLGARLRARAKVRGKG